MEKIEKRAAQAVRQVTRKIARKKQFLKNGKEKFIKLNNQVGERAERQLLKDERLRRQETWLRGPLAPRYDVGKKALSYGCLPPEIAQKQDELEGRRPDFFHVQAGDRVIVTKGRMRGRIAEVDSVDQDKCVVYLKDIMVNVLVPEHMRSELGGRRIVPQLLSIPIGHVRLVYALKHAETGIPTDVVIAKLELKRGSFNRQTQEYGHRVRVIAGTNTIIPWPESVDVQADTYDIDTREDLVLQKTYVPSLFTQPMPSSLIDELRNKYSKFRTRHDRDYVEKIEKTARRDVERKELIQTMRTPLQQLAELRAKQKAERQQELTPEQLAKIGEIMQGEREAATVSA